jgi:hypothetical protein
LSVTVQVTVDGCGCSPCSRLSLVWHIGPALDTTEEERVAGLPPIHKPHRKADVLVDLQADKKVALSLQYTDEVGNAVPAPVDAVAVYTVDDPSIIALTDNGDGTASAAATGTLGTANVHVEASSVSTGLSLTGDLQLVVVAGLAERIAIVAGEPEEVTPDL